MALNYSNIDELLSATTGSRDGDYLNEKDSALIKLSTQQYIGVDGGDDFIDVQIYDNDKNLIGIAKLATPVKKTEDRDFTFKLKLDF